jgi:hypothetical protein
MRTRLRELFDSSEGASDRLIARWLFLRALGLIYFSAFLALIFQARGLIGTQGILPAADYLTAARALGAMRFWDVPSLLWISSSDHTLMAICWCGLIGSLLLAVNIWPRAMLVVCFACFLSFASTAQEFSGYQSDGMLLAAGFLSLFLAPPGLRPGWGARNPPMRAAILLLLWEWFRIYFESGVVKLASGDPTWRNLTALYEYYQNGPLPTWVGWYLQHLPHWFHIATAALTLGMELVLVWMALLPGRWRVACFWIVTAWQVVVIATANYAFLNYLVLVLAVLLLDDGTLTRYVPARWRAGLSPVEGKPARSAWIDIRTSVSAVVLLWIFYATSVPLVRMFWQRAPLPDAPVSALEPFRIANEYGLFAVMTPHRFEIEFQGSNDGQHWTAYPFRFKPQDPTRAPGIYAPYQPRFDWNLWFASLGASEDNPFVTRTEALLLLNDKPVLGLFAGDPFHGAAPRYVRTVRWQYWFSTKQQERTEGVWWTRQLVGEYGPTLERLADGRIVALDPDLDEPAVAKMPGESS